MFCVYILFSSKLNRFYVGTTDNIEKRIIEHNTARYSDSFTTRGIPWELVLTIDDLHSKQAKDIEKHIKKMKSTKYIQNLIQYPEMKKKLIELYK